MIEHIDVDELDRVEDAVIVDVREPHEHAAGALPDAVNIPLADFLEQAEGGTLAYDKEQMLIIHCRSGSRSLIATEAAKRAGWKRAHNLRGGFEEWVEYTRDE